MIIICFLIVSWFWHKEVKIFGYINEIEIMLSSEKVVQFVVLCVCQWRNWTRSLHKNYGWYSCLLHSELLMCICFYLFYWDIIFFLMILVLYCVICLQHLHLTEAHSNIRLTLFIFTQFTSLATKLWQLVYIIWFAILSLDNATKTQSNNMRLCYFVVSLLWLFILLSFCRFSWLHSAEW
jgi:hypothetical protein